MQNPYDPPKAEVTDAKPEFRGGVWLWLGGIYLILGGVSGLGTMLFWDQIMAATQGTAGGVSEFGIGLRVLGIASSLLSAAAGVLLIMRRALSWKLLAVLLVLSVGSTLWSIVSTNWLEVSGISGLTGTLFGLVVTIALMTWARKLTIKGVFR